MEYIDVGSARERSGLRLVLTAGVPGPWGQAAKGLFHVKKIPFAAVAQEAGGENAVLREWTGHDNAPVAVHDDEPPRATWTEILFLAERLAPEPVLIPADPGERALMFGLCHEICGEGGFGWSRRLMMLHELLGVPALADSPAGDMVRRLGRKYGYAPEAAAAAPERAAAILALLSDHLSDRMKRGQRYFVGDALSALDITWAAFAAMLSPLPEPQCPMPDFMRAQYAATDARIRAAADPALLAHRDFIYGAFLELPVDL